MINWIMTKIKLHKILIKLSLDQQYPVIKTQAKMVANIRKYYLRHGVFLGGREVGTMRTISLMKKNKRRHRDTELDEASV